jgi:choline dehydrogenase
MKQSWEIMAQPSMARYPTKEHLAGQSTLRTKDHYMKIVKAYARTSYHPVGSGAMGDSDQSVVAPDLRPQHGRAPSLGCLGPTPKHPTVMIAEKPVDLITGHERYA